MNTQEIGSIPAGDVLNGIIAVEIMGWTDLKWRNAGTSASGGMWPDGWYGHGPNREVYLSPERYSYSTNMVATKDVIEKMNSWWETRGICFEMGNNRRNGKSEWWTNIIHNEDDTHSHSIKILYAETLELSVCRAALWEIVNGRKNPTSHW